MIKIVALNNDGPEEVSEEEVELTKEAQETVVEAEYVRAIKLNSKGKIDLCLRLLKDLLKTQVLNENLAESSNDKLGIIRYNSHKHIAALLEEKGDDELALQHYILAVLIDDSDVFTLHKFGQLALKLGVLDLAEYAFETCLVRNSTHWLAEEGMLQTLCRRNNMLGAFNWATKMLHQNPHSNNALQVYQEIASIFKGRLLSYDTSCLPIIGTHLRDYEMLKPAELRIENPNDDIENSLVKLQSHKTKVLSWLSIGQFIKDTYSERKSSFFMFNLEDILISEPMHVDHQGDVVRGVHCISSDAPKVALLAQNSVQLNEIELDDAVSEQFDIQIANDNNNDDSDSNAKSDGCETNKKRRRCSDLHFLEQWGWHKSRRYASRKKPERDEIDVSLNNYLRKLFSKHTKKISLNNWPFRDSAEEIGKQITAFRCRHCSIVYTEETFQTRTQDEFKHFLKKFHQQPTDLMHLVFNWLKCVSLYWNIKIPDPVKDLYLDIFEIYTAHFDLSTWNQLTSENFEASFRICVFFLEIDFRLNDRWKNLFKHLIFNLGNCQIIEINLRYIFELRLVYLEYLRLNASGYYKQCLACLQQISQIMSAYDEEPYVLHLPNLSNICLNKDYIDRLQNDFQRQIDANRIPKLFENGEWQQLAEIITKAIESSNNSYENEFWFKDFCVQIQILLQSFWNTCSYENCFIWSEKCLHYIISNLLAETRASRQKQLAELHNFVISYIEVIILNEGFHAVTHLSDDGLSRLVQNIISILVFYLDGIFEKNNTQGQELDFKRLWVVLHQILLRDENDSPNIFNVAPNESEDANELIPKSFSILFTAHEFLGKRQWCSKDNGEFLQYILDAIALNLKAPIYDGCRDLLYEHIEQVTYCLFKYPQKKARCRHLEDHEATQVKLNWLRAVQVFDLYRPEKLPEFNSYKLESISSDMEQLLLKIISLMPQDLDLSESVEHITKFIEGQLESLPEETKVFKWPYKINSIFYLLADFYFKSRDFFKAIKYYILDLAVSSVRFDSWAGIALSKASKIETKLNGLGAISPVILWEECEEVLRCFECCVNLNRYQALLWIEYGSFTYTIHSYFSRYLKHDSENLSMEKFSNVEEKKTRMLNIAFNCFSYATSLQNTTACPEENADANDEKWLCQYMLGKISEKRKEEPKVYLNHYLMAANYLYENNATYPIKLNHSNPTTLSVEALEVFYRINASIIKFLEHEKEVTRTNVDLFNKVLKNLSNSPFAYNKAKVDGNSLNIIKGSLVHNFKPPEERKQTMLPQESPNASRRESQETLTTPTISKTSESSSSESESDTDASSEHETDPNRNSRLYSCAELEAIFKSVVQNIEECVTRFPEHYKSIYRLTYHYMYSLPNRLDYEKCEQLLLGQYKTSLGNTINGLFYDRKNSNIFNGIWRIPSPEIDRPGNFSTHLAKCINILIQLLLKTNKYKLMIDVGLHLHKTPDVDKRYITDNERKELFQQSLTYCVQILRGIFQKNVDTRNDMETLNLLIDIYKIHKKCLKYMSQKEVIFTHLLVEVYKFFIKDKIDHVPESVNFVDLAIKLCVQEISVLKNLEKSQADTVSPVDHFLLQPTATVSRTFHIPGLSTKPKLRTVVTKLATLKQPIKIENHPSTEVSFADLMTPSQFQPIIFDGMTLNKDSTKFQGLFEEYYAKLQENENKTFCIEDNRLPVENASVFAKSLNKSSVSVIPIKAMKREADVIQIEEVQHIQENDVSISKLANKGKNILKKGNAIKKPYNRSIDIENISRENQNVMEILNIFKTLGNHTNILAAYANLLQSNPTGNTEQILNTQISNIPGASTLNPLSNINDIQNVTMHGPSVYNTLTSSEPIKPSTSSAISCLSETGCASAHATIFSRIPQVCSAVTSINSTKTLQEKLAERQKACQLHDKNNTANETSADIIILD
ncbi:uncharacterized protein LOC119640346 isoform X1 [Glossina fuscipes]|uniref:Uncharacterized protein LOC119640346 isoform X1 n=1 Tax=Glossina fuscipes TaxID=7396 RepID=A0A9C5ZGY8_9MUSC|nr:uncharacterized protein LOC119640346 isoform X1 [Glossina fuscipes]XP_037894222.1 uncharacterized protein LOC119640346 isoform X1 [Glossina fuscipes]